MQVMELDDAVEILGDVARGAWNNRQDEAARVVLGALEEPDTADEEGCATCRASRQWCADPYHASSFDEDDLRAQLAEMDEGRRSAITLWRMAVRSESAPPNRVALAEIIAEKMGHERSDDSPTCMDEDTTLGCRHANGHPAEPGCDTCCDYGWPCAPALAAADAVLAAAHVVVPRSLINR